MSALHYLATLVAGTLLSTSILSAQKPEADPAAHLRAFNETCRQGFPDLQAVGRSAVAQGWVERPLPMIVGGPAGFATKPPRLFNKSGFMLFLTEGGSGQVGFTCQVAGSTQTRLSGRDIAALVSPSLNAGEASLGPGDPKKDDYARWTVAPGTTVEAGISVYRRKVRTISMAMRQV